MLRMRCLLPGLLLLVVTAVGADEPSGTEPNAVSAEAAKQYSYFDALSRLLDARLASGVSLTRSEEPLLNWTIDRSWQGSFYVWTANGRPAMVGCFLADTELPNRRRLYAELHAIADEPFTPLMFRAGKKYEWNPTPVKDSAIAVSDFAAPAKVEPLRRTQLHEIAGQFDITMFRELDSNDKQEELRMLSKPLYRYPAGAQGDGIEGAVYAFVTTRGTDPEFLLAVECDPRSESGNWVVRPMRFCTRRLELRRHAKTVWRCEPYTEALTATKLSERYAIIQLAVTNKDEFEAVRERILREVNK